MKNKVSITDVFQPVTDCGPDGGCEECDVCSRLNFLEWARSVSGGVHSVIEKDERVDAYIERTYGFRP